MRLKKLKWLHGLLVLIFLSFAGMQYNDPDSWEWIMAYLTPAVLFGLLLSGRYYRKAGRMALIIIVFAALLYIPDLYNWIVDGFPSITASMQAEKPLVEFMREFFGLVIISLSLWYYNKMKY